MVALRGKRGTTEVAMQKSMESLTTLLEQIRACKVCEPDIVARPVLRASATARLAIISQAPGMRAHNTGLTFNDASGDRLRDWIGLDREVFYDEGRVAIVPMGFCFPGYDSHGGDKAPKKMCASRWRARLFEVLPDFRLVLLVGSYAQAWHLRERAKENMTATVAAWRDYAPLYIPLPHPSWRNNGWLKKNPWFERELLPDMRRRVRSALRA